MEHTALCTTLEDQTKTRWSYHCLKTQIGSKVEGVHQDSSSRWQEICCLVQRSTRLHQESDLLYRMWGRWWGQPSDLPNHDQWQWEVSSVKSRGRTGDHHHPRKGYRTRTAVRGNCTGVNILTKTHSFQPRWDNPNRSPNYHPWWRRKATRQPGSRVPQGSPKHETHLAKMHTVDGQSGDSLKKVDILWCLSM